MKIRLMGTQDEIKSFVEEFKRFFHCHSDKKYRDHKVSKGLNLKYLDLYEVEALRDKNYGALVWVVNGRVPRQDARWELLSVYDGRYDGTDYYTCGYADTDYDPDRAAQLIGPKACKKAGWRRYDGRPWW